MNNLITSIIVGIIGCTSCLAAGIQETNIIWNPTANDIAIAEKVARTFCWNQMSDQQRTNEYEIGITHTDDSITLTDPRPPPPNDFTIQQTPFSKYERKHLGTTKDGKKLIIINYYDPKAFPDWNNIAVVSGGYPGYFSISVDMENKMVCNHYAESY